MAEKESEKIEIRSDEVQDILGMVPSWIVRWGTVLIFLTVLVILAGSWFFRYPDIIRADITVTTENPPSTLEAGADGPIELFVRDGRYVETDDHLAMIGNAADYKDYVSLKYEIESLKTIVPDFEMEEFEKFGKKYQLGDMQQAYTDFISAFQDYYDFLNNDSYEQSIHSQVLKIQGDQALLRELERERNTLQNQREIRENELARTSKSFDEGNSTLVELEDAKQELYEIERSISTTQQNIITNNTEITLLKQDTSQIRSNKQTEMQAKQRNLRATFNNLDAEIGKWEQKYLLIALTDGLVSFTGTWAENQNVNTGERVLTVVPKDPGEIIGKIDLPVEGSGKVNIGDPVNIKFDNFPYLQFGMVGGRIRSKSQVPDGQFYSVDVELTNGLVTFYGDTMAFNQEMPGRAEIITDNLTLLDRITSPIRSALTEQREARKTPEQD